MMILNKIKKQRHSSTRTYTCRYRAGRDDYNSRPSAICQATAANGRLLIPQLDIMSGQSKTWTCAWPLYAARQVPVPARAQWYAVIATCILPRVDMATSSAASAWSSEPPRKRQVTVATSRSDRHGTRRIQLQMVTWLHCNSDDKQSLVHFVCGVRI